MTETLARRRILLVIGGGIAAYKALDLIRRLRERGASVCPVLTAGAQEFVTPLAAAALAGERAHTDLFDRAEEADIGHIKLARQADAVVVAPATANLMARMAGGHAADLATTILLATTLPILIAPAMNVQMWAHPATRRNRATLEGDGVRLVGPNAGKMAEAETGPGRMAEPNEIADALERMLEEAGAEAPGLGFLSGRPGTAARPLAGRRVLVTSGPTHEPIDPVRYLANRSSGRQGHAIAAAAAEAGATVTLVSGPVAIPIPPASGSSGSRPPGRCWSPSRRPCPSTSRSSPPRWPTGARRSRRLEEDQEGRHRPGAASLVENPDILSTVSHLEAGRPPLVVGFAAETDTVLDHARAKIARKGCDLIVANDVSAAGGVMGGTDNTVHLIHRDGAMETWPRLGKDEVARRLVAHLAGMLTR